MHEGDAEVLVAIAPLAVCLFFVTFFVGNICFPVVRLSRAGMRLVWIALALAVVVSVAYAVYQPPDGMDEGLALVASSVKLRDGLNVPCRPGPPNQPGGKVKIISYADGPRAIALGEIAAQLTQKYVSRHVGFSYYMHHDCRPRYRHLQWTKIPLLFHELQDPHPPEWLLWLDADAVFTNVKFNVYTQFLANLQPETVLVVAEDIGGGRPINTGMMAMRCGKEAKELLRLIWDVGRDLKLMRAWFHEQGTLTHLVNTVPRIAKLVVVLGGKWDEVGFTVKMYSDGALASPGARGGPFVWKPGDTIGHAIGPRPGGTDKLKALLELQDFINKQQ